MDDRSNRQGLHLHELQPIEAASRDFSPSAIAQWAAELPLANIDETTRQVSALLIEANLHTLRNSHRLKLLDQLSNTLDYATQALRPHYIGKPAPLEQTDLEAVAISKRLQLEMVLGYKRLIEFGIDRQPIGSPSALSHCLAQALRYLTNYIIISCQSYQPIPGYIWSEANRFYRLAEKHRLNDESVSFRYIKLVLIGLSNPCSLQQTQLDAMNRLLDPLASLCTVGPVSQTSGHYRLPIYLDSDQPPGSHYHTTAQTSKRPRILDTSGLIQRLHQAIARPQDENCAINSLPPPLLRHLIVSWSGQGSRGFSRIRSNNALQALHGLSMIHDYLRGQGDNHYAGREPAHFDSHPLTGSGLPDLWDMETPTARQDHSTEVTKYHYRVINEGAGGFCLAWNAAGPRPAIILGEVIGVFNAPAQLSIGVIRWINSSSSSELIFGIELLSPSAIAVETTSSSAPNTRLRGLLLPPIDALQQPSTLLTSMHCHTGDIVDLFVDALHPLPLRIGTLVQDTGNMRQYHYETIARDVTSPASGVPD